MDDKCNIYRVNNKGMLESAIDHDTIVSDEVMKEIEADLYNFLRKEENRKGEYYHSSQSIVEPKTTLDKK